MGLYFGYGGYRQMALYGPFLSALRGMEQDTVQTACSGLSGELASTSKKKPLPSVDTVMAFEEQGLGLVLKRPRSLADVGRIGCKIVSADHISPLTWPIVLLWSGETVKI